jgi:hypothetical protein
MRLLKSTPETHHEHVANQQIQTLRRARNAPARVEPFPEIHKRVSALMPDEGLIIVAPFLPSPLVEKLASEGFSTKVERGKGADWMVYFWREAA